MTSNKKRYYFAYGSNLNIDHMLARCPGAEIVGWAELKGHELLFKGSRRGSFLTVEPGESSVWIGVWSITAENEHALDRYEDVPKFYEKREIALDVHLVPTPRPHPTTYRKDYKLDYRIIASEYWNNRYSWTDELDKRKTKTATDDICTIAFNLGFRCTEKAEVTEYGKKYYYKLADGTDLFEVKVYKNGNAHYKFNTEFSKAFNIEAGRILGWLRNKQEAKEEFNTDAYFNVMNSNQLQLGFGD